MNISSAFLEEVKRNKWPIYYVHPKEKFKVGDAFRIVGTKCGSVSKVVLTSKKSKEEITLVPIKGSLKLMSKETNSLLLKFDYRADGGTETFFMRFHFFKFDPAVFTFWREKTDDDSSCCDCCDCCCCNKTGGMQIKALSQEDGDRGGGGGGAQVH